MLIRRIRGRRAEPPWAEDVALVERLLRANPDGAVNWSSFGFMQVGEAGGIRVAISRDPRFVIKVSNGSQMGTAQDHNGVEARNWDWAPAWVRAWMVPTLAVHDDGLWLVMARAEPAPNPTVGFLWQDAVEAAIFDYAQAQDDSWDTSWHNTGWHEGGPKLLDYGP